MTCPSELTLMMYADGGLDEHAVAVAGGHLTGCAACRGRLEALQAEGRALTAALAEEPEPVRVPRFERPSSRVAVAAGVGLLMLVSAVAEWGPRLIGDRIPAPAAWFSPFDTWSLAELAGRAMVFVVQHGDVLLTALAETVVLGVLIAVGAGLFAGLRGRRGSPLLLVSIVGVVVLLPGSAEAVEIRHQDDGSVLIPADETINDTLIALGETVEIAGDVEGDLIAFARRVFIRGRVGGQVITGGETVTLEGEVGGSVTGFARTLTVSAPSIGGNLYGFGRTITTSRRIEQDALVFGEHISLGGEVGSDVMGFGEQIEIGDAVGGALTAYANRVVLLAPARIGGDVTLHVPSEDNVTVSPGAVVGGELITDVTDQAERDPSRYATGGYYIGQLLRFAAAFVTGLVVLTLVPALRRVSVRSPTNALVAGGLGLVTMVAAPVIAVLVAITIIGIPVALVALMVWLAGLYLAKIVIAHAVGARLLENTQRSGSFAAALAVGLLSVLLVVNLPLVGGIIDFLLTICGLGLIVLFLWDRFRSEPAGMA